MTAELLFIDDLLTVGSSTLPRTGPRCRVRCCLYVNAAVYYLLEIEKLERCLRQACKSIFALV